MWSSWFDAQFPVLLVIIAPIVGGWILAGPVATGIRLARMERELHEMARKINQLVDALAPQPKEGTLIFEQSAD